MKESQVQQAIMQYLAAKGILAFRMNTGAVKLESRFMRFGSPGMADILAFPDQFHPDGDHGGEWGPYPMWIEVKAPDGKQSDLQKTFQKMVQWHGHKYVLARSIEDVEAAL
jgi:VRR-NUC domain